MQSACNEGKIISTHYIMLYLNLNNYLHPQSWKAVIFPSMFVVVSLFCILAELRKSLGVDLDLIFVYKSEIS